MRIEKHMIGQTFIVRYMEDTDSDIIGLGFLITSSLMWISNRVTSSVLAASYYIRSCSECVDASDVVFGKHLICQKVIVSYMTYADNGILESYRDEIVQGRVRSETASFDKI